MNKIRVLFVCVHNSARSQMAEALLKHFGGELFEVESAGLEEGKINPLAVAAMKEMGIDISRNAVNSVFAFLKEGRMFHFVITVCDESQSERCPIFPGRSQRRHWSFEDPAALQGSKQENLQKTIDIRDQIKQKIMEFIDEIEQEYLN